MPLDAVAPPVVVPNASNELIALFAYVKMFGLLMNGPMDG